jgi:sugar lactone lactonase YvrE
MMTAMTTFVHFRRITLPTIWMMMVAAAAFFPARADAQTYRYHTQIGSRGSMWLHNPSGLTFDANGNIYVADTGNSRIRKFDKNGNPLKEWGSNGSSVGQLKYPEGIVLDSQGNLYVADTWNHRVVKYSTNGDVLLTFGVDGYGQQQIKFAENIAIDADDNIYISDNWGNRIQKFDKNGVWIQQIGGPGSSAGQFNGPYGLIVDKKTGHLYVADTGNHRVQKFLLDGTWVKSFGGNGTLDGQFKSPKGIGIDHNGNVYIGDNDNHRIQKFSPEGVFLSKFGTQGTTETEFWYPYGVAFDANGRVYICDMWNGRIAIWITDDTAAPETTATTSVAPNDFGWFRVPVNVQLTAKDDTVGLGIRDLVVAINADAPTTHKTNYLELPVATDGIHTYTYYSVDLAGNTEATKQLVVRKDTVQPVSQLNYAADGMSFTLTATDDRAGIERISYRMDGGTTKLYTGTVQVDGLRHEVKFWSTDNAGNVEFTNTRMIQAPDTLAPTTIIETRTGTTGLNGWFKSNVTVKLKATDNVNGSGVKEIRITLDGTPSTVAGSTASPVVSGDGIHSLSYYASDVIGNTENTKSETIKIDTVKPTTALISEPRGTWFTLDASDVTSGIATTKYAIDGAATQPYIGKVNLDGNRHTITFFSEDKAGNIETTNIVSVGDPTKPISKVSISPNPNALGWNKSLTEWRIQATDNDGGSGIREIRYTIDGGTERIAAGADVRIAIEEDGPHTLSYYAVDEAGNTETAKVSSIKLDQVDPVTTPVANAKGTSLALPATDNRSGIARTVYTMDGGAEKTYVTPLVLDGKRHTIVFWSEDVAGNTEDKRTLILPVSPVSFEIQPQSLLGGATATGQIRLSGPAPTGGLAIALKSSSTAVLPPASVVVPAGQDRISVNLLTTGVAVSTTASITATGNAIATTGTLTVLPGVLSDISITPGKVPGGLAASVTISMSAAAPSSGMKVFLLSDDPAFVVPPVATIPAGKTSVMIAAKTLVVGADTDAKVTASVNGVVVDEDVTVQAARLAGVSILPAVVLGGKPAVGTITLTGVAPKTGLVVTLSDDISAASVPTSVAIKAGAKVGTFTVTTSAVSQAVAGKVTAKLFDSEASGALTVRSTGPALVKIAPVAVAGGKSAVGTVTLTEPAPVGGLTIQLSSNTGSVTVPTSVVVPAGKTVGTFTAQTSGVTKTTIGTITATVNGLSASGTLTVLGTPLVTFTLAPAAVSGGQSVLGQVTIAAASSADTVIEVTSAVPATVQVPATVTIPAGKKSATFTVTTSKVIKAVSVKVTASSGGIVKTVSLNVKL